MVLSLALAGHSRLVHGGLDGADTAVGEALMLQHIVLLGELDGGSEDMAVARYKLGTYYYSRDLLQDAGGQVGTAVARACVRYDTHRCAECSKSCHGRASLVLVYVPGGAGAVGCSCWLAPGVYVYTSSVLCALVMPIATGSAGGDAHALQRLRRGARHGGWPGG